MTTRGQTTTEKRVVLLGSALSLIPRRPLGLALCLLFHLLLLSVARAEDSADAETLESTKHRILFENLFLEAANTRGAERKAHEGWWERLSDDAAGETSLLFVTPMFRSNLHLKYAPEEVEEINKQLTETILERYLESVKAYVADSAKGSSSTSAAGDEDDGEYAINDDFFETQQENPFLPDMSVMQELAKDFIAPAIKKYWRSLSTVNPKLSDDVLDISDFKLWATVNHWDIAHQLHIHTGSIFSGVYYVKVPSTAGGFRAVDPRGHPQYPFQHSATIYPEEGDLILFPGWMPHTVLPTMGGEPRIAIAFNVDGDIDAWSDMTNIEHSYEVI